MPRVCHISTVHDCLDNRIFQKQCRSLYAAGYDVSWVVQNPADEVREGIEIVALPTPKNRTARFALSGWQALKKAIATQADVYHFHDPELIPQGIALRLLGKQVIYDIHEDYVSSISQKHYLPRGIRTAVAKLSGWAEQVGSSRFVQIIAERYYDERFPNAVKVLNYPVVEDVDNARCSRSKTRLLYTGKVHDARGAMIHSALPRITPGVTVDFIGKCSPKLHQRMVSANFEHQQQLKFEGIGRSIPFLQICEAYQQDWLAGLAIFPHNEHLERKELTKFFEYMLHGLPIIASHFSTWRSLVEDNQCGICVDPTNESQIADAIRRLQNDSQMWQEMANNGMACVREKYSWSSQERVLLDLYDNLLS